MTSTHGDFPPFHPNFLKNEMAMPDNCTMLCGQVTILQLGEGEGWKRRASKGPCMHSTVAFFKEQK